MTHGVWHIIGYSFAKHWGGQSGVDVLGVQILILAVEKQCGCFAAQQVGEGFPHHGETEHGAILSVDGRDTKVKTPLGGQDKINRRSCETINSIPLLFLLFFLPPYEIQDNNFSDLKDVFIAFYLLVNITYICNVYVMGHIYL